MTKVLIVSKTHMTNAACIGAITGHGRFLRLLDENADNQPVDTDYEIRQIWEIDYTKKRNITPPHVEDVLVSSAAYYSSMKDDKTMQEMIERNNAPIVEGSPDELFNGYLCWTDKGSGYISQDGNMPPNSVGFWIPDRPLRKQIFYERVRYNYPKINGWRSIPYVGFSDSIDIIPAGTLLRVSLARWRDKDGETEPRCSLQLSGWYEINDPEPDFGPTDAGFPDDIPY